jgi:hypothetical protein
MSSSLEVVNMSDSPTLFTLMLDGSGHLFVSGHGQDRFSQEKPVIYVASYEDAILIFLLALSILGLTGLNERFGLAGLFSDGCGPHLKGRLDHIDAHHGEGQGHTAQPHTWP